MAHRTTLAAFLLFAFACVTPSTTSAAPFGGQAIAVTPCFSGVILAHVGPPMGGAFIWSPMTQTYRFGPPSHAGQWVIGLSVPVPYPCVISITPVIVSTGILMTMLGSSQ